MVRALDGDTLSILVNGRKERVRLRGVDAPESIHKDPKRNVPMGKTATDWVRKRLEGLDVVLEFERAKPERDRHGSYVAYVRLPDGALVNLELVERGLSPFAAGFGPGRHAAEFQAAEKRARDAGLGIWGDPKLKRHYLERKGQAGRD